MALGLILIQLLPVSLRIEQWRHHPSMSEVRAVAVSPDEVFIAVPLGVYILDGLSLSYRRCLTYTDGLGDGIELIAWNAARAELIVSCCGSLNCYLPGSGLLMTLHPPFSRVRSTGTGRNGAYFDTYRGLFRKHTAMDVFERVDTMPRDLQWQGGPDTGDSTQYVFLTPYHFVDEQLFVHNFGLAQRDSRHRRLFVAVPRYGALVYGLATGCLRTRFGSALPVLYERYVVSTTGLYCWRRATASRSSIVLRTGRDGASPRVCLCPHVLLSLLPDGPVLQGLRDVLIESGRSYVVTDLALFSLGTTVDQRSLAPTGLKAIGPLHVNDTLLIGSDKGLLMWCDDSLTSVVDPTGRTDWGVYDIALAADGSV